MWNLRMYCTMYRESVLATHLSPNTSKTLQVSSYILLQQTVKLTNEFMQPQIPEVAKSPYQ